MGPHIIYAAADTGIYSLSGPNLGKPVLDPIPQKEWWLPKLNEGEAEQAFSLAELPARAIQVAFACLILLIRIWLG